MAMLYWISQVLPRIVPLVYETYKFIAVHNKFLLHSKDLLVPNMFFSRISIFFSLNSILYMFVPEKS